MDNEARRLVRNQHPFVFIDDGEWPLLWLRSAPRLHGLNLLGHFRHLRIGRGAAERYNSDRMSRVVYTELRSTGDQEALRQTHQVRIVNASEEGSGVNALPGGVYGFTYSPGLPSSPLFAIRRYRSYETHKLPSGEIYIIGFATANDARSLS